MVDAELIEERGRHYKKVFISLDVARDKELFELYGDFILVEEINAGTTCEIRLNDQDNDPINLLKVRRIESQFSRFYLTNDALTGGYIKILIGGEAKFTATPVLPVEVSQANIYGFDGTVWQKIATDTSGILKARIAASDILVPVDLQSIQPKKSELYDADETLAQSITLDTGGFKTVEVVCHASAATTFTVEYSFDNIHWFTYYSSPAAETDYTDVFTTAAQYIRVSSAAAGIAGDTVTLVIAAKP